MRLLLICAAMCGCLLPQFVSAQNTVAPSIVWHHNLDDGGGATPREACIHWLARFEPKSVFDHLAPTTIGPSGPPFVAPTLDCWVVRNGRLEIGGYILATYECAPGFRLDPFRNVCEGSSETPNPNKGCGESRADQPRTCNPIALATGHKYLVEDDYQGTGPLPLTFRRYYTSRVQGGSGKGLESIFSALQYATSPVVPGAFSAHWRSTYDRTVHLDVVGGRGAYVYRPDGQVRIFRQVNGVWITDADVTDKLVRVLFGGVPSGWEYTSGDDDLLEIYDVNGRLTALRNRQGLTLALTYNAQGKPSTVTDSFGRSLLFHYDSQERLQRVTLPDSGTITYAYDAAGNLGAVTHPDAQVRTFHYNEGALTAGANLPHALTGITDENGGRFSNYGYAADGRAVLSEHAGGVIRSTITYGANSAVATDARGQTRAYSFSVVNGVGLNTAIAGPACPACGPVSRSYDAKGFPDSSTDWNGNRTNYTRDARDLEVRRVEGLTSGGGATSVTRTITTEWHPDYRLPTRIAEAFRLTTFAYGAPTDGEPGNRGSLLTKTVQATTDASGNLGLSATPTGLPRTWTYTYNSNGQPLTVDGPRADVSDVTRYTYYANDATCPGSSLIGCRGQTATITNALGHITTIDEYNAHGQPLRITDANGLVTTLSYDARMRLTGRNVGGELSTYSYDAAGQLVQVTLPDGSALAYSYDAAHRLTRIQDSQGNRIVYTLDLMGNRTKEDILDPAGALAQTRTRVYDSLNRLFQEIGAQAQTTTYAHDDQGNVISIDGPLAGAVDVRTNAYDALNRLIRVTDPHAGQVNYRYDGRDHLVAVSDPRTLTTTYAYDGLDNLNQLVSPDTGTTTNTYDTAGNVITAFDAKGQQSRYTYDALNRVTKVEYFGTGSILAATHTYAYDAGANQKGRLTQLVEPGSTTVFSYDQKGRLTSEARTINGVVYTTGYSYDTRGRLAGVIYPGGRMLAYTFDTLGRIEGITSQKDGENQVIVSNVLYQPFGGPKSYVFGNGQTYSRGFDADGRISSYTLANQTISVQYDGASRITALGDAASMNAYGYDALDRLISFAGSNTNQSFSYDAVGNRATKTAGVATSSYSYAAASNRLAAISGASARTYTHDVVGSVTADGVNTYAYDARGRMAQVINAAGTTDYAVNALGQRIRKTNAQGDTVYHYDSQGHLIAESTAAGAIRKEYVYLGEIPVAVLQ